MTNPNPELVVLPFKATLAEMADHLTFEQVIALLNQRHNAQIRIERSYPGAKGAIGWTLFRRTPREYLYENEPLFRFERGARRHLRRAYAIEYSLNSDDLMTYSHLHL